MYLQSDYVITPIILSTERDSLCLLDVSYRLQVAAALLCIWNDFKQNSSVGMNLTGRETQV